MTELLNCTVLVKGMGEGRVLKTGQTISFWGGVDPETGKIIDPRHPLFNEIITSRVLVFPFGKGSAAAPLVLLELARQETFPAAIINVEIDPLLVAGPVISYRFYGKAIPVVKISQDVFDRLHTGQTAVVDCEKSTILIK